LHCRLQSESLAAQLAAQLEMTAQRALRGRLHQLTAPHNNRRRS
jgi:hypothetical protein